MPCSMDVYMSIAKKPVLGTLVYQGEIFSTKSVLTKMKIFRSESISSSSMIESLASSLITKRSKGRSPPTKFVALEVDRDDRLFDVHGNFVKFRCAGPAALEQPVRVAGLELVVRYLEALAAEGVGACRDPVPLHADVTVKPTCKLVRREERPPWCSMASNT